MDARSFVFVNGKLALGENEGQLVEVWKSHDNGNVSNARQQ
jgi:hypothetical protein